jgi:hypothetical protein
MRRVKAASAARGAMSRPVPPCSWRIHAESSPWEFGHYQLTSCDHTSRRAPCLGSDRVRGFRPGPVWRADLLRIGLHRAIDNIGLGASRRTQVALRWIGTSSHWCGEFCLITPMSDPSHLNDSLPGRALREEERELISSLLPGIYTSLSRVMHMQDGGMGGIRFFRSEPRSFGKALAEAQYLDSDGVLVSIVINADSGGASCLSWTSGRSTSPR